MTRAMQALLIIDHGSRRPDAGAMLAELVRLARDRVGSALIVEGAHMEFAEPTVADGFDRCVARGATEVIAHPLMLAAGQHATRDIPRLVAEAAARHPGVSHRVTPPLGPDPRIVDVVLERCGLAPR